MAIAAKPSLPSGLLPAADWAAISVAAASEMRVIAAAVVASAAIPVAVTNDNDHPSNGHDVDNCLHDGYEDMIVNDGPPSFLFLSNDKEGNAFPTRHTPSNADAQPLEQQRHQGQSREEICEQ
jgi:hypothetical protein